MSVADVVTTDPDVAAKENGSVVRYPNKEFWYYVQRGVCLCDIQATVDQLKQKHPRSSFDVFGVIAEM